jgi:hypothetical protein
MAEVAIGRYYQAVRAVGALAKAAADSAMSMAKVGISRYRLRFRAVRAGAKLRVTYLQG